MQSIYVCKEAYWEFVALFKDVFVKFYIDEERKTLYQVCEDLNEGYYLEKGNPCWKAMNIGIAESELSEKRYTLPKTAIQVARKDAENIEDYWNEEILSRFNGQ